MTTETYVYQGYRVRIMQDEDAPNPREEFDNIGSMVCWHNRYILGDKKLNPRKLSPQAFLWDLVKAYEEPDILEALVDRAADEYRKVLVEDLLPLVDKFYVIEPLWLYDHSGLSMSRGSTCPWDSGQVGFQFVELSKLRAEFGNVPRMDAELRELGKKLLDQELGDYDQYLRGDVWGFAIKDADGVEVDSCWGHFGFQYAKDSANEAVEALMESRARADWEDEMERQSKDAGESY